jgi:hypothetical protein
MKVARATSCPCVWNFFSVCERRRGKMLGDLSDTQREPRRLRPDCRGSVRPAHALVCGIFFSGMSPAPSTLAAGLAS